MRTGTCIQQYALAVGTDSRNGQSQCIRAISLQPVKLDSLYQGQLGFRDACLTFAEVSEAQRARY